MVLALVAQFARQAKNFRAHSQRIPHGAARALGQLPKRLIIYAVEAASFTLGAPLSKAVAAALESLPAQIGQDLVPGAV